MTTTAVPISAIDPVRHKEAMAIAAVEYDRFLDLISDLEAADWARLTDCPAWDVRQMVAHVVGTMEANASLRENMRQQRLAAKGDGPLVDELTARQVREHEQLTPAELVHRVADLAPRAVKGRRRMPPPVRAIRIKVEMPYGTEKWSLGFLVDTIFTRDTWMHRVDIARATGREMRLTTDHDGRIVADIVADWAGRHGQPFTLVLEGAAGGTFESGDGGEEIQLDAVEFCRIVSGRAEGAGLLTQEVPF